MGFVLCANGEVDKLVVLVNLELLHAVLGQSAKPCGDKLCAEHLFDLDIKPRKVLNNAEVLLGIRQILCRCLARINQLVNFSRSFL